MDEADRCHKIAYLSYGQLLASGTTQEIIAAQNLTTLQIRGHQLLRLEEKRLGYTCVEQTVIFGNALHVTGRDQAGLRAALFATVPDGYEIRQVETTLEDAITLLMKTNDE